MGWLESDIVDFTPEGKAALDLADELNGRDVKGVDWYIDQMNSGEFSREVLAADPVMLFASLDADSTASMIGALDPKQAETLLYGEGAAALSTTFEQMPDNHVALFVNTLPVDGVETMADELGVDSMMARAEDVSSEVAANLDRKLQQTDYRTEEEADPRLQPEPEPEPEPLPDDGYDDESDSSSSSGCFVATAVYGDPWHPDVCLLRRYRETVLRKHAAGRAFIALYARFGPHAATLVKSRPWLHAVTFSVISGIVDRLEARYGFKR
jgi:hypothetical protein